MSFISNSGVLFLIGLVVGLIWTAIFGPLLDRIPSGKRNWHAYAIEAVGVFVMSVVLDRIGRFTPLNLLGSMISAGIGMFFVKIWR